MDEKINRKQRNEEMKAVWKDIELPEILGIIKPTEIAVESKNNNSYNESDIIINIDNEIISNEIKSNNEYALYSIGNDIQKMSDLEI